VIKDAQDAHGLRNRNYQRYRQYCARRLRRLRTATNVKSMSKKGDKRFSKKKITPEMVNDPRFLLVSLVSAERDWAHEACAKREAAGEASKAQKREFQAPLKKTHCHLRNFFCLLAINGCGRDVFR
jgi:signal recognition particle subunit SRP68